MSKLRSGAGLQMQTAMQGATQMQSNSRLRTLIVDDEPLARRGLCLRLSGEADIEIIGECQNGREAFVVIAEKSPDLVFLDVQMPGMDGFDVLRALPAASLPMVVFVTAYDQYAVHAFEASAVDYLLKPIDDSRLHQALHRVRETARRREAESHCGKLLSLLSEVTGKPDLTLDEVVREGESLLLPGSEKLAIKDGGRITRVDFADISWIDAAGDYMCIHANGQTHILRGTLRELEERLDARRFQRIHRSVIVNLARVKEILPHINGEYFLVLDCGNKVKMSRSYKDKISLLLG